MKKVNTQEYRASRRGFSLVEVVVGMVLIIMVSGASIFLVMQHSAAERTVLWTVEATNIAENAVECFHAASDTVEDKVTDEDTSKFEELFFDEFEKLFFDGVYGLSDSEVPHDTTGENTYVYVYNGLNVAININVDQISVQITSPDGNDILTHEQTTYMK